MIFIVDSYDFDLSVCLSVCPLGNSSSFSWYLMKFGTLADIFPDLK